MTTKIVSRFVGSYGKDDEESVLSDFDLKDGEEKEESIDEMKIQTMYKMVDDVAVNVNGKQVTKKILYLTNKQAVFFDDQAMQRCIQALDIGEPKFVIKLLPCIGVKSQMNIAHEELIGSKYEYTGGYFTTSEIDKMDERTVETQMILFMRTCILPLAKQTRAVIIVGGANDCAMSAALANVALAEQSRLGPNCPFTVIAFASEFEVHSRAVSIKDKASVSAQLCRGSRAWRRQVSAVSKTLEEMDGKNLQRCDLTAAAERYIVFEGIDFLEGHKPKKNTSIKNNFEATFLSCLTKSLPSIAIQSHMTDLGIDYCAELISRKIPVLFIDTVERAFTYKKPMKKSAVQTSLGKKSDSFPAVEVKKFKDAVSSSHEGLTQMCGNLFLNIAEEMMIRKYKCQIQHGICDSLDASTIAFFHSVLKVASNVNGLFSSETAPLFARILELEKLEHNNKEKKVQVPVELVTKAITMLQLKFPALEKIAKLKVVEDWLQNKGPNHPDLVPDATNYRDKLKGACETIQANGERIIDLDVDPASWLPFFDILASPNTYSGSIHDIDELKRIIVSAAKIDRLPSTTSLGALKTLQDAWDNCEIYHLIADSYKLAAKVAYSLMLFCGILITIFSIIATSGSVQNFKSSEPVIILSFVNTALAAYISFMNPVLRWQSLRVAALNLESNIWLFRTRAGPFRSDDADDKKAEKLLAETVKNIKADILEGADVKSTAFFGRAKTRNLHGQHATLTAGFGVSDSYFVRKEDLVEMSVTELNENENPLQHRIDADDEVSSSPSNKSTGMELMALAKMYGSKKEINIQDIISKLYTDGGNDNKTSIDDAFDSYYEPVQPDGYIKFRTVKALNFYKSRIPAYNRSRNISQFLLVAGSIASAAVAFARVSEWAAVISATTLAISAYLEFNGTNSKLTRYSSTVHGLQELIVWWNTLPQIERSVLTNIDKLIVSCEDILQGEQRSWKSTSQASKMLDKAVDSTKSKSDQV